jgi:hypothetical protein
MTSDADLDVGWQRRYRETDLGAALLLGAAVPAAFHLGCAAMVSLVVAGIILTIAYRERRIERVGREIWLTDSWWLFRPLRVRRRGVQPGRVALTVPESGWLSRRRTLLTVDGHEGPLVVERWRHPSERIYASQLATDLSRWFGVRLSGVLAPFDNRPDTPARWASLRASLDMLKGVPGDAQGDAPLPYRLSGRRPARDSAIRIWMLLVGVGLMCLSRLAGLASGIDLFAFVVALPLGAMLATYGLAGALPGAIRVEISPAGLQVERLGLRPDVRFHIPFTNVTWLGPPSGPRKQPTLQIGCTDAFANLTAGRLGLTPEAFERFCGAYRRALAGWLDARLDQRTGGASQAAPPAPPTGPVELDDRRAAPNSVVTVLAQLVPRLSVVMSGAFIVALFLLVRGPASPVPRAPWHIRLEAPHLVPFLGLKVILAVSGFAAVAAALAMVGYLFLGAPKTGWHYVLMIPLIASPLFLAMMGGLEGMELLDCWNICAGPAGPARYRVIAYGNAMRYGPYEHVGRFYKNGDDASWLKDLSDEKDLVDVEGVLGGRYLLRARDYHPTCDAWRAHLPAVLRKEGQP